MGNVCSVRNKIFCPPKSDFSDFTNIGLIDNNNLVLYDGISILDVKPKKYKIRNRIFIFSHGNGSDITTVYPYIRIISNVLGIRIIIYDYPGYGLSKGTSTEKNCIEALRKTILYTRESVKNITLIGESLGTGVIIGFCYYYPSLTPKNIILISPFKSIIRIFIDSQFVEDLFVSFETDCFKNISRISFIKCPIQIYHGSEDSLVPLYHSYNLCDKCVSGNLTVILNCGHNDILEAIPIDFFLEI